MMTFGRWWRDAPRSWGPTWLWAGVVVVLFCLPLFRGLNNTDVENDEAIYSFAVDIMLKSGDWLTPRSIPSETLPFLEKPPLKFWLIAAPISVGLLPHNELGMRVIDALFGSIAFLYVFAIGRRLGGSLAGALSVLMLFVQRALLFEHGLRNNNMESPLFLAYCAGMYHFLAWRSAADARRRWHVVAIGLSFTLGFMTKFVAALFMPIVLAAATVLTPADRVRLRLDWRAWLGSGALAAAIIAPWFIYQYIVNGTGIVSIMFGEHVVQRFTASLDPGHVHPWYFYPSAIVAALRESETILLAAIGAIWIIARAIRLRCDISTVLILWGALPLALMSLGTSKLYHYAYPFLPPIAIASGYAAAGLVTAAWSPLSWLFRGTERIVTPLAEAVRGRAFLRGVAMVVAAGSVLVAVVTLATGQVLIAFGDSLRFRSSNLVRPWLVAAGALVIAGPPALRRICIAALICGLVLPINTYRINFDRTAVVYHPLRSVRQCMQTLAAVSVPPSPGPGVWAEGRTFSHSYFYYLRDIGPWQERSIESDATVVMNLYVPDSYRPVLIAASRHDQLMQRILDRDPDLIDRVARKADITPAQLVAHMEHPELGRVRFPTEVLVLPGPYSVCAPQAQGASARR